MDKRFIEVENCKISYIEKNSNSNKILFFIHGNSGSANTWYKQFNTPALQSYRLIAFDLPGHGDSDQLNTNLYNAQYFASLLSRAIAQLSGANPFILIGLSFGTNVLVETLSYHIRPNGITLLGSCIIGGPYTLMNIGKEGAELSPMFSDSADQETLLKCIGQVTATEDEHDLNMINDNYARTAPGFRPGLFQSAIDGKISDELALLKEYAKPLLVIFGSDEKSINPDYLDEAGLSLWNNKIYKLSGGRHFVHLDKADEVNQLLHQYAQHCL